jgi:WD40 repeat protein/tRNA A-37 threonylcarbamoyl transferase component Bud32
MHGETREDPTREQRLDEVVFAYLKAVDSGAVPDRAQWLARYPDFAAELAEFFADQDRLDHLTVPLRREHETPRAAGERTRPLAAPPASGPPASPGDAALSVGDYDLLGELGRGGMGVVYRARHRALGRTVALKMIRTPDLASAGEVRRFRNEAETAAALDHPHIVPVYEVGEHRGSLFFSMKLVEGRSLAVQLARFCDDPRSAARLVATVARAVHHAHQRGVLHRDLKPSNILLDAEGRPHVTDFGLAKRVADDSTLTQSGGILGTPSYMAPEQADGPRGAITTAADVYGLGAVLYALLTGHSPFRGPTALDTLERVRAGEADPPRRRNPRVDRDLETVCLKCLEKDPVRRYASAAALAEDLESWLAGEPIQARPGGAGRRLRRWCRRNPRAAVLTGAAAVTLVLVACAASVIAAVIWQEQGRTRAALDRADEQRLRAIRQEAETRRQLYVGHIHLAHRAWEMADPDRALDLLNLYLPEPGQEDLRGFEWHHLRRLCQARAQPRLTLAAHAGDAYSVAFTADGTLLASAGKDRVVRLWDPATGVARRELRGHTGEVNEAAFSPDGRTLASAGDDGVVKLWDVTTGRERAQLVKAPRAAVCVAFAPGGRLLAAGFDDGRIRTWDFPSGHALPVLHAHRERVEFIAFSTDGQSLATAAEDVKVWDVGTRQLRRLVRPVAGAADRVSSLAFAHGSPLLATPASDDRAALWDLLTGKRLFSYPGHGEGAEAVALSPDDRLLATGSRSGTVRLWEVDGGKVRNILGVPGRRVWSAVFSPDGRTLGTASSDGAVRLWDPVRRPDRRPLDCQGSPYSHAYSVGGARLAVACAREKDTVIELWDAPRRQRQGCLPPCTAVATLQFARDGASLVTGHVDGAVSVWDLAAMRPRLSFRAHTGAPALATPAPDGNTILTSAGGREGLRVWDSATGHLRRTCAAADVASALSPERTMLVTAGERSLRLWAVSAGAERVVWSQRLKTLLVCAAFSPDGTLLATGHADQTITLWEVASGRARATLIGAGGPVHALAFSADGKTLASGGPGSVKLWHVATGQELYELDGTAGPNLPVAFAPDGQALATYWQPPEGPRRLCLWLAAEASPMVQGAPPEK